MFQRFTPDYRVDRVYEIDLEKLHKMGFEALLFDIDNTLVLHEQPATEETIRFFQRVREAGMKSAILSNNGESRSSRFAKAVHADALFYHCRKPSPAAYLAALRRFRISKEQALFFGDQLFTDILGAKNAALPCCLVDPVGKELYLHIRLKRILERPIRASLRRKAIPALPKIR